MMKFRIDSRTGNMIYEKDNEQITISPEVKLKIIQYCGYSYIPVKTEDQKTYIHNWFYERLISNINSLSEASCILVNETIQRLDLYSIEAQNIIDNDSPEMASIKDLFTRHTAALCSLFQVPYGPPTQDMIDRLRSQSKVDKNNSTESK